MSRYLLTNGWQNLRFLFLRSLPPVLPVREGSPAPPIPDFSQGSLVSGSSTEPSLVPVLVHLHFTIIVVPV